MSNNEICEVQIQTEGYQGGYVVRVVGEDDTETYHIQKHELVDLVSKIRDTAITKGTVDSFWKNVA